MENIKLCNETTLDYRNVEELTRVAFWYHHVPGCNEHYLLHIISNCDALPKKDKQSGLPSQERFFQLVNMRKPR